MRTATPHAPHLKEIGDRIAARRYELDLRQEDVATQIGRTRSHVANLEAGAVNMSVTLLFRIAEALNVDPAYLLTGH